MDKETLGQYGWVVICVIVLAIMITLATPFGNKIAGEVVETVTNMTTAADTALDEISVGGYDGGVGGGTGGGEVETDTKYEILNSTTIKDDGYVAVRFSQDVLQGFTLDFVYVCDEEGNPISFTQDDDNIEFEYIGDGTYEVGFSAGPNWEVNETFYIEINTNN